MNIRLVDLNDLEEILNTYSIARSIMKESGNPNQWGDSWPPKDVLIDDINKHQLYCVLNDLNEIVGCFAAIEGIEETYLDIEDGKWLNNCEYVTIHRLASNKKGHNVFHDAISFMKNKYNKDIRIDTHEDNLIMQHLIYKEGFKYTGIIYVYNGNGRGKRLAYQLVK